MGDQFALMEAVVALAVVLRRYSFRAAPGREPGMTTGGCINDEPWCSQAWLAYAGA